MANSIIQDVEEEFKAIVLDCGNEMYTIGNIRSIKVVDKDYNLLIMRDYLPVIGQINGSVTIEANSTTHYDNIEAFYALSHNIFNLIIKEHKNDKISEEKDKKEEKKD